MSSEYLVSLFILLIILTVQFAASLAVFAFSNEMLWVTADFWGSNISKCLWPQAKTAFQNILVILKLVYGTLAIFGCLAFCYSTYCSIFFNKTLLLVIINLSLNVINGTSYYFDTICVFFLNLANIDNFTVIIALLFVIVLFILIIVLVIIRGGTPRYSLDQVLTFSWINLLVLSLVFIVTLLILYIIL